MISRRFFLKNSLLGTIPLVLPISDLFQQGENTSLFIDESGFGEPSVIGILRTTDSLNIEKRITELRNQNKYYKELRYRSTDKYKLPFSKDLIDYFFSEPSMSFHARFISENVDFSSKDALSAENKIYEVNLRKIVSDCIGDAKSILLLSQGRNTSSQFENITKYFKEKSAIDIETQESALNGSSLYELADLFTGCVFGDQISISNPTKIEIINHINRKLNVKNLSELYNIPDQKKFQIKKVSS